MKKFKTGVLALAMVLGVAGAFVTKTAHAQRLLDPTYDWVGAADAPNDPNGILENKTIDEATDHYGCQGTGNDCAFGERVSGTGPNDVTLEFGD